MNNKELNFVENLKHKRIITTKQYNWLLDIKNKGNELSADAVEILNNIERVVDSRFNQQKPTYKKHKQKAKPKRLRKQFSKKERLSPVPNTTYWNRGK